MLLAIYYMVFWIKIGKLISNSVKSFQCNAQTTVWKTKRILRLRKIKFMSYQCSENHLDLLLYLVENFQILRIDKWISSFFSVSGSFLILIFNIDFENMANVKGDNYCICSVEISENPSEKISCSQQEMFNRYCSVKDDLFFSYKSM